MSDKYLWLKVTLDEYELPLIVADTIGELANRVGVKATSISKSIDKARRSGNKCQYKKVRRK